MGSDPDHPDARRQYFRIHSPAELDIQNGIALGSLLSNIPNCAAYYDDLDSNDSFMLDLSDVLITPIFYLMQQDDYYFNAEEYGGEEMLDMAIEYSFGHWNYIALRIEPPDAPLFAIVPVKTLCKGWDPGDDPPAELMPLINYLENVIIPEMHQHPYP